MGVAFKGDGWEDYLWWEAQGKPAIRRVNKIINDTLRHPFEGLGKPERLQHELSGLMSRRITQKDRMVYSVYPDRIEIIQLRYHYAK